MISNYTYTSNIHPCEEFKKRKIMFFKSLLARNCNLPTLKFLSGSDATADDDVWLCTS